MSSRQNLMAKIHIGKKELGLDDETYRQGLQQITGKISCREMNIAELLKVLQAMQAKGFKVRSKFKEKRPTPRADKASYLAKITALLCNQGKPQKYADRIAKKAFGVDFVHWLEPWQLKKVIQMLAVHQRRELK
jgi:hypothetical protein|uniref:Regulatory protein GemA n=1 Tax=Myoviridae sp. ctKHS5 TaxID=2823541 RepID=A0A8S5L7T6_9CAUD|nr:MAG TPA: Protein of unknown function DUF1018 [Myoviridae sp. ctKHS5]